MFERMLKTDMLEAQTGEVVIQDVEEKTMEKLLEFIYTGEIDNMDDQLEMLLYAADYYEIQGLVSEGRIFLDRTVSDPSLQERPLSKGCYAQKCHKDLASGREAQPQRAQKGGSARQKYSHIF